MFTKGHDFKEATKFRSRGSVKSTKCVTSATIGTCLQQWFGLGIIEYLTRKKKKCKSMPPTLVSPISPAKKQKSVIKGRNNKAIAMISESITVTTCTDKFMDR